MAILRKTVQREVIDQLDGSVFTAADFETHFGDAEQDAPIVQIQFHHDEAYTFELSASTNAGERFFIAKLRPGAVIDEEVRYYDELSEALGAIPGWCQEIRNELKAVRPEYEDIAALRALIEAQLIAPEDAGHEFSVKEINVLREKFEALRRRVRQFGEEELITQRQVAEVEAGIDQVLEDLEFYPKAVWIKTAANKLVTTIAALGHSEAGRAILDQGAEGLFGEALIEGA